MTDKKNFLGIPVEGEVYYTRTPVPQKSQEDLRVLIEPVLAHPKVEAIRWRQYTPYFNDGEPCVFDVSDVYFRLTSVPEEAGDYEDGFVSTWDARYVPEVAEMIGTTEWDRDRGRVHDGKGDIELYNLLRAFEEGLGSAFNDVLMEAFGDHAEVTVRRNVIEIETYEHD